MLPPMSVEPIRYFHRYRRTIETEQIYRGDWLRWTYGAARIARLIKKNLKLHRQTAHLWQNILLTQMKVG